MVTEFVQLGEKGQLQSESYGVLNPTLLILGSVSDPHTHPPLQSPFYYSNWEQNIWTQHCFRDCSCIPPTLPPLLFAELSPALWDLVKTKSHYRGESGLAQPTREYEEPQM